MFIRAKKIKNGLYAYKVKNRWTGKGVRQKVSGYLGRVVLPEQVADQEFAQFLGRDLDDYMQSSLPKKIVLDLASWMLSNHGFKKARSIWEREGVSVRLSNLSFKEGEKNVVIKLGQDYMCRLTLRKLLSFKSDKDEETTGRELAKAFISAGIAVPQEVFISIFGKIYSPGQSYMGRVKS
jgi:hypothetical protein